MLGALNLFFSFYIFNWNTHNEILKEREITQLKQKKPHNWHFEREKSRNWKVEREKMTQIEDKNMKPFMQFSDKNRHTNTVNDCEGMSLIEKAI